MSRARVMQIQELSKRYLQRTRQNSSSADWNTTKLNLFVKCITCLLTNDIPSREKYKEKF